MEIPSKSIPSDIEAERAVIGSCLIDPDAFEKIADLISARDFYRERHGWLFEAMRALYKSGVPMEFLFICHELERMGRLDDVGGAAYITDLISMTPTAMFVVHYTNIVIKAARLRRLIGAAQNLAEAAYDNDADPAMVARQAIGWLEPETHNIAGNKQTVSVTDHLVEEMSQMGRYLDAQAKGETLGLRFGWQIDEVIGGMQPGNAVVVAARPGVGKTTLALNMALKLAERGHPGAFFSLEMSASEIVKKLIANYGSIDSVKLRNYTITDEEVDQVVAATERIAALPLSIVDSNCSTLYAIRQHVNVLMKERKIEWVVVDYIQLMGVGKEDGAGAGYGENRQGAVEFIVQGLKAMARDLGLVVIVVSQLNRGLEYRAEKRPMLADLRSSGAIEQSGDSVIFIHRDEMYTQGVQGDGTVEINVAKNRHGRTGMTKMYLDLPFNRFADVTTARVEFADVLSMPAQPTVYQYNQPND